MTELLADPRTVLVVALTFGFAPRVILHLAVRLYPQGHDRRAELIAEAEIVPFHKRPVWVADVLAVCIFEGLSERARYRRLHGNTAGMVRVLTLIQIGLPLSVIGMWVVNLADDQHPSSWLELCGLTFLSAALLLLTRSSIREARNLERRRRALAEDSHYDSGPD